MGSARDSVPSSQFISVGVDFLAIYQSVFDSLLQIRSNDGIRPGHVVLRADDGSVTENGESFLNAFYRSLGLPAIRDDARISAEITGAENSDITQNDTLNYFHSGNLGGSAVVNIIAGRESVLQGLASTKNGSVTQANIISGLKFMLEPAAVDSGITGSGRPSINPLIVAGDVTVYPVSRRICPLFYPGDFQDGSSTSQRAFIESVIYNTLFKTDDTQAAKDLRTNIRATTGQNNATDQLDSKNILVLRFLQKAYSGLAAASAQYFNVLQIRDQLYRKVSYVPALKRSGPSVKQGYYDLQHEEIVSKLEGSAEGELLVSNLPTPEIDKIIKSQMSGLAELDSFYNMLPYNIANTESQIGKDGGGDFDSTPSRTLFADLVVDIATIDRPRKAAALAEAIEQQRVLRNNMEIVRSQLEIFTGTTTGLSVFDILAFFIAFYLIEPNHLIGLLNDAAIERLRGRATSAAFSGIGLEQIIDSRSDVQTAVNRLSELVKDQINLSKKLFVQASGSKK